MTGLLDTAASLPENQYISTTAQVPALGSVMPSHHKDHAKLDAATAENSTVQQAVFGCTYNHSTTYGVCQLYVITEQEYH